jgi:MFS family permease
MRGEALRPGTHGGVFYGWWIVGVAFVTQAISIGFTSYAFGLFQGPITAELHASSTQFNLGMTLFSVAMALFAPFLGQLLDRHSIRRIMALGGALMATGFVLMSLAPSLLSLGLLFGVAIGLGAATLGPLGASKVVANWFVHRRGRALGFASVGTSVGGFLAPPLVILAIEAFGWRGALVAMGAVVALVAVPLAWLVIVNRPEDRGLAPDGSAEPASATPEARSGAESAARWSFSGLLRERNFWVIGLSVGLCFATLGSLIANLPRHATDLGIEKLAASFLLSALSAAGIVGKIGFGALADRVDKRLLMWLAIAMLALYYGALRLHIGYGALLGMSIVGGLSFGGFLPMWGALIGMCYGRESFGRVMGLMAPVMGPLNWLVFPLTGWVRDTTGSYDLAWVAFIGALALAALLLTFLRPPEREPGT